VSGASPPAAGRAAEPRSGFDIALAMFVKRRRAVAAAAVLLVFFLAAVWTPLLANHLPLRFRGYDRAAARTAWRVCHLETGALARALAGTEPRTAAQVRDSFGVVEERLGQLGRTFLDGRSAAAAELGTRLAALRAAVEGAHPADPAAKVAKDDARAAEAKGIAAAVKERLRIEDADVLRSEGRWPALQAMDGVDVGLAVLGLSGLAALPFLRKRPGRRRRFRAAALAAFVPPLLAGAAWGLLVGRLDDPTDYAGGAAKGSLVAEVLVMPPVPWGLNQNDLEKVAKGPGDGHALGTDENGRDLLCRMLWGSRISLSVGFVAVGIYVLIGIVVGAVAGYAGGWADILISRLIEWVICFPVFFLILVIVAFLRDRTVFGMDPPQLLVIMVVIGVTGWTGVARLVRAEFLRLTGQDYVMAARALGAPSRRIIFGHVLPNAMAPVFVAATFGVAGAILLESALSFLGLGITVPKPSWGGMLFSAHGYETRSTWLFLWPGLAIFLVITCYNLVGEALRDALDPRLRQ
jgi:peptide/nickel transport system permease protein